MVEVGACLECEVVTPGGESAMENSKGFGADCDGFQGFCHEVGGEGFAAAECCFVKGYPMVWAFAGVDVVL